MVKDTLLFVAKKYTKDMTERQSLLNTERQKNKGH